MQKHPLHPFRHFRTVSSLSYSFSLSLASISLLHKRNAYVCTIAYTLLDGSTMAAKWACCVLQYSAYTNPANACGHCRLAQGYPPLWTTKALLSKLIAVTDLAHGRLPQRMISEVLGLRDLKLPSPLPSHSPRTHAHTHTHIHTYTQMACYTHPSSSNPSFLVTLIW